MLLEAFRWPTKLADAAMCMLGPAVRDTALCNIARYSSAFSGIGTAEVAMRLLQRVFRRRHGVNISAVCESVAAPVISVDVHSCIRAVDVRIGN
jgi:hypothetical protein